jgi:hypothetical protein
MQLVYSQRYSAMMRCKSTAILAVAETAVKYVMPIIVVSWMTNAATALTSKALR